MKPNAITQPVGTDLEPLPTPAAGGDLPGALERRKANRQALMEWIRAALVDGIDFGRIHSMGKSRCPYAAQGRARACPDPRHWSKPSLFKPGAEKICGMLGVTVHYPSLKDYEQAALGGVDLHAVILRCELRDASGRDLIGYHRRPRNLRGPFRRRHTLKLNAHEVRSRIGNWDAVLAGLAPELDAALSRKGRHVPCPVHGGRDGFRLFRDPSGSGICNTCGAFPDGFALLQWLRGWSFPQALEQTVRWLGIGGEETIPVAKQAVEPQRSADWLENRRRRNRLQAVWDEALPLGDGRARPARLYLARRGLRLVRMPAVLRYHPELAYFDDTEERVTGAFPVLLALVTGASGQPVTIHRTYLSTDGRKAPVDKPKKLMTYPTDKALTGGSIRLFAPGSELGLAEGIETALAIAQATGMPVWSCVSAALLEQVEIPRSVRQVRIWADRDRSGAGRRAAEGLGERLRDTGRRVQVLLPDPPIPEGAKGLDWLDILNHQGEEAVREVICGAWLRARTDH